MAIEVTPVYRNLHQRVTFFYLEFEDLFFVIGLAAVMNIVGRFLNRELNGIPLGIVLQYVVPLIAVPVLMLFKYGKPRGYLRDLLVWHAKPHIYCGLEPDREFTSEFLR
ncbi:MAG: hypothetical protein ACK5TN_09850 [Acidobacteriota bacterium]|jgi:hypothetical protein|uniref:hypothetical protein n=1 Tax=Bryobacter aggregatus TaxID=360054 RepID=UPI0004E13AD2|nr:hypothetical protein [Bryobacter aggregatus]MDL5051797.1 hypothetical protein [Oscillatoria amoena NRMC-F 0135]